MPVDWRTGLWPSDPNLSAVGEIDLGGAWAEALDREDVGVHEEWFTRELADPIRRPGALRDSGYGDEVTAETEWMSGLHDPHWYLRKEFKKYAQPGNVKVPIWPQPRANIPASHGTRGTS
jgi:hypothetical protein